MFSLATLCLARLLQTGSYEFLRQESLRQCHETAATLPAHYAPCTGCCFSYQNWAFFGRKHIDHLMASPWSIFSLFPVPPEQQTDSDGEEIYNFQMDYDLETIAKISEVHAGGVDEDTWSTVAGLIEACRRIVDEKIQDAKLSVEYSYQ